MKILKNYIILLFITIISTQETLSANPTLFQDIDQGIASLKRNPLPSVQKRSSFLSNRAITLDIEHIFKPRIMIYGFHHDLNNQVETSLVLPFSNKKMGSNGVYSAELYGNIKTFFPATWSRSTVIEKIYEAYNEFASSNRQPIPQSNDTFLISGKTQEGIEITMVITKNGHIKTAYPLLN